jgi:ankyrin repeat protein
LAKEQLIPEEVNNRLLLAENEYGQTAWHLAAEIGNIQTLSKLWECAKELLTAGELKSTLLLAKDIRGNTACEVAEKTGKQKELDILR